MVNLLVKFMINVIILISIFCSINRLEVISRVMFYMVLFYSQIIRYSRICNDFTNFSERVFRITNDFIKLIYKADDLEGCL